jgi:tetratricopeptide (TPR) repeat protein/predicted Ser/Thr protein kinase
MGGDPAEVRAAAVILDPSPDETRNLGAYELARRLGAGGMGVVWLARDPRLEREVALKVLPEELRDDPQRRQRFLREARAVAKLAHPNITAIHEIGEADGRDFIAFEYVEGTTLDELVRARPRTLAELVDLALPLADALGYAHERGVIHRDLKATNVMVSPRGHPKLLDFGLAKILREDDREAERGATLTQEGAIFGTPHAMSPEQALGRPVDARSDVFSFGSLLYELAAGRAAFGGATPMEILDAVIHAEPPDLAGVRADLPSGFAAVVAKAMRKDPLERYQRMADLAAELRRIERAVDGALHPRRTAPRRRTIALAIAAATVALIGFAWHGKFGLSGEGVPLASGDLSAATVGVLGFENLADPADPRHLNRMLMGLVTTNLSESGGLDVISTPKILAALREVAVARGGFDAALAGKAADRAGVRAMLVGQITPQGEGLLLTAELVDVAAGRTLGSWTHEAASDSELFDVAKSLGDGVRASLGRTAASSGGSVDLARALTSSAEAYRQFAAGELALHEFRFEDAVARFEQALRIDPSFALSSYRLGMSNEWLGREEDAVTALRGGLAHVGRLPARWQAIYRGEFARNAGDYDVAFRELTAVEDSASDVADFQNALGEVYTHADRYADARRARACFERTLEIDPTYKVVLFHLMENCLLVDDEAAAERLVKQYRELDPRDPAATEAEIVLLLARGKAAEAVTLAEGIDDRSSMFTFACHAYLLAGRAELAERVCEEALARTEGYMTSEAIVNRALARVAGGRLEAVRASLVDDLRVIRTEKYHAGAAATLAMVAWSIGAPGLALDELKGALLDDRYSCVGLFWLGFASCEAGRIDEADQVLATLDRKAAEMSSPLIHFWRPLLAGVLRLSRDDVAGARRELDRADSQPLECRDRGLAAMLRARLETAAGNRDAAIAAWRELLDPPYLRYSCFGQRNLPWRPIEIVACYELARLEEQRGGVEAAREHYRRFLDHWGSADLPLASIGDARARLAALEGR